MTRLGALWERCRGPSPPMECWGSWFWHPDREVIILPGSGLDGPRAREWPRSYVVVDVIVVVVVRHRPSSVIVGGCRGCRWRARQEGREDAHRKIHLRPQREASHGISMPWAEGSDSLFGLPLLGPSWGCLGALLGRLGSLLSRIGALLGRLGRLLGASWAVLGRPGAVVGVSSIVFNAVKAEKVYLLKMYVFLLKINDFGLLGPSSGASWKPLGPSWTPLEPSWSVLGASWAA